MRKLFSTRTSDNAFSFAMLVLRVGFGALLFLDHGYDKLMHFSAYAQKFADPFNIGQTRSLALVVFAEAFCSVFVILGLFTRLACIPIIIAMGTAFLFAHHGNYHSPPTGGELALLFLIAFTALLFTGPGKVSVDRFIGK